MLKANKFLLSCKKVVESLNCGQSDGAFDNSNHQPARLSMALFLEGAWEARWWRCKSSVCWLCHYQFIIEMSHGVTWNCTTGYYSTSFRLQACPKSREISIIIVKNWTHCNSYFHNECVCTCRDPFCCVRGISQQCGAFRVIQCHNIYNWHLPILPALTHFARKMCLAPRLNNTCEVG